MQAVETESIGNSRVGSGKHFDAVAAAADDDDESSAEKRNRISLLILQQSGTEGVPQPLWDAMVNAGSGKLGNRASRVKQAKEMYTHLVTDIDTAVYKIPIAGP